MAVCSPEPKAQSSAEPGTCGHMLPWAVLLPLLITSRPGRAAEGASQSASCSWLCHSREHGREGGQALAGM